MRQSAREALEFVEGFDRERLLADRRTRRAVLMSFLLIGEAAARMMDHHPDFVANNPAVPWTNLRGMRNRIAHAYFALDFEVIWATLQRALPDLLESLDRLN